MWFDMKFLSKRPLKIYSELACFEIMAAYEVDECDSLSESSEDDVPQIGDFSDEFVTDFLNVFGDSDEEEEFEGFRFEMPPLDDVEWTLNSEPSLSADPDALDDLPEPGPTMNIADNANALFYFQLFFGDDILKKIVEWTEKKAATKLHQTNGEQWKVTVDEKSKPTSASL